MENEPGVHCHRSAWGGDHRVALQLGQIVGEAHRETVGPGHGQQQLDERVDIHWRLAPKAGQQLGPSESGHHGLGVGSGDGGQPQHHLVEHLGEGAAQAEGSHWAERGPVNYPHQQLHPGLRLLFHQETVETPAGLSHCYRHLGRFVVQLEGGHPHTHRVHIALVHHASAEALQHQRLAQPIGRHQISQHRGVGHRVVEGRHHAFGYYYPSIGEQRLDFGLGDDHVIPSE